MSRYSGSLLLRSKPLSWLGAQDLNPHPVGQEPTCPTLRRTPSKKVVDWLLKKEPSNKGFFMSFYCSAYAYRFKRNTICVPLYYNRLA